MSAAPINDNIQNFQDVHDDNTISNSSFESFEEPEIGASDNLPRLPLLLV